MSNTNATMNTNWVFVPVHKSRVIKVLEKAIIVAIEENVSTILPRVFMRKKETETHIFFSVPADFNINVRYETYDMNTKKYGHRDVLKSIGCEEMKKLVKHLSYEFVLPVEKAKALNDMPF